MCSRYVKVGGFFSVVMLISAVLYQRYHISIDLSTEIPNILNSLQKAESKVMKNMKY